MDVQAPNEGGPWTDERAGATRSLKDDGLQQRLRNKDQPDVKYKCNDPHTIAIDSPFAMNRRDKIQTRICRFVSVRTGTADLLLTIFEDMLEYVWCAVGQRINWDACDNQNK